MNREQWLNNVTEELKPIFKEKGYLVPDNVRISVGFPSKGVKSKVIGECWSFECSSDEHYEIFIHPNQDDPVEVSAIIVHELVHAIVGHEAKHGPEFKELATKMGLEGKMKATVPGSELTGLLKKVVDKVGPYPHKKLIPKTISKATPNPSVIKLVCPKSGYIVRTSKKWVEQGYPTSPCGEVMIEEGTGDGE